MAKIGDQLLQPESGWKRYDDTDSNITYEGDFKIETGTYCYEESVHFWCDETGRVKFNFIGSKIRIVSNVYTNKCDNIKIKIDNSTIETYTENYNVNYPIAIVFEKTDLEFKEHYVEIYCDNVKGGYNWNFDAVDIDENGELKPYNSNLPKYLIQDKNSILYTFNGTDIVQAPSQTLDEDNFKNNGINNITSITEEQWNKIFPNKENIKILMWTDDIEKQEAKLTYECEPFELTDWLKKDECKLLVYTDDLEKKECEMIYNCEPYKPINRLKETGDTCKVLIKEV